MVAAAALLLIGVGVMLRILHKPIIDTLPEAPGLEMRDSVGRLTAVDSLQKIRDLRDDSIYGSRRRSRVRYSGKGKAKRNSRPLSPTVHRDPLNDSLPTSF